jgi:hypothetical protein
MGQESGQGEAVFKYGGDVDYKNKFAIVRCACAFSDSSFSTWRSVGKGK